MANDVSIRFTAEDVASEVIRKLGINTGQLADRINPLNAAFGALGATLTTGAVVAALVNTVRALDALEESAKAAQVSVEALSGLRYAASFAGVESETLQKALVKVNERLADAASGGKESASIFRALGLNVKDASGQIIGTDEALLRIAEKFSTYRDGVEKGALATKLFGERIGPQLLPFLEQGRDGIQGLREEAERLGVVISGEKAAAAAQFADQMDRLGRQFEALRITAANAVLPTLTRLFDELERGTRLFGSFSDAIVQLGLKVDPFKSTADNIANARAELDELYRQRLRFVNEFGEETDAGQTSRNAEIRRQIDLVERRIQFLQEQQRANALAGATGILDANDARARGQDTRGRAPGIPDPAALAAAAKAEEDRIKRSNEIAAVNVKNAMAQIATDQLIEEQFRKSSEAEALRAQDFADQQARKLESLQAYLGGEQEVERQRFEMRMAFLDELAEAEPAREAEIATLRLQVEEDYQNRLTQMQEQAEAKRLGISKFYRQLDLESSGAFLSQLGALMNSKSRALFEVGKAGAIGETIINTYRAATGAYAALAGIPVVGPALGAAAAAAAVAAGVANVQRIKSTTFGGGGQTAAAAVTAPGQGPFSAPAASVPVQPAAQAQRTAIINLSLSGSGRYTAEEVRGLIEQINEQLGLGAALQPA